MDKPYSYFPVLDLLEERRLLSAAVAGPPFGQLHLRDSSPELQTSTANPFGSEVVGAAHASDSAREHASSNSRLADLGLTSLTSSDARGFAASDSPQHGRFSSSDSSSAADQFVRPNYLWTGARGQPFQSGQSTNSVTLIVTVEVVVSEPVAHGPVVDQHPGQHNEGAGKAESGKESESPKTQPTHSPATPPEGTHTETNVAHTVAALAQNQSVNVLPHVSDRDAIPRQDDATRLLDFTGFLPVRPDSATPADTTPAVARLGPVGGDSSPDVADAAIPAPPSSSAESASATPLFAGLFANVLPFDMQALDSGVKQFFETIEDLGIGLTVDTADRFFSSGLLAVAAVMAIEIARRQMHAHATTLRADAPAYKKSRLLPWLWN